MGASFGGGHAVAQTFGPAAAINDHATTDAGDDSVPQVVRRGTFWVMAWHSSDSLGGTVGTDLDILYALGDLTGGWGPPTAVAANGYAATDSATDAWPQLLLDGSGPRVVVWASNNTLDDTIGGDFDILISRTTSGVNLLDREPVALNSNAATDSGTDIKPQVTSDGAGNWVVVWESTDTLGGTIGSDWDILVSRSSNQGLSWSTPVPLHASAASDSGDDRSVGLTTDDAGGLVAVWESTDTLGGTIGTDGDILVSRSSDGGATWSAPTPLHDNATSDSGDDRAPYLGSDGAGSWVAVWHSTDSLGATIGDDWDILVTHTSDAGATWSAPSALNGNAAIDSGSDLGPRVISDGVASWVAVWESNDTLGGTIGGDSDILVSRSSDAGATWSPPAPLDPDTAADSGADGAPRLAGDRLGRWVAVWSSTNTLGGTIGSDFDILYSSGVGPDTDGDTLYDGAEVHRHGTDPFDPDSDGDGFDDAAELAAASDPNQAGSTPLTVLSFGAFAPLSTNWWDEFDNDLEAHVATDGAGLWLAIWLNESNGLVTSRSVDEGTTWSAPTPLPDSSSEWENLNPRLATDGAGNWVAAWESTWWSGNTGVSDGDILISRSSDDGLTWTSGAPVDPGAATDTLDDRYVDVATDGNGNWAAIWWASEFPNDSIVVSRSSDAGATWTTPVVLSTGVGRPRLVADGDGTWLAVFDGSWGITVSRSSDAGATWTVQALPDTSYGSDPYLATDGLGSWLLVFSDRDSLDGTIGSDDDILLSRSTDAGATWSSPVALDPNAAWDSKRDDMPRLASDGAGNWVAIWRSWDTLGQTIGTDTDMIVSQSSDDGLTWSPGLPLNADAATDSSDEWGHELTTDGLGNWVATWLTEEIDRQTRNWDVAYAIGSGPDRDGDGLADGAEVNLHGTDRLDPDSDGDGLSDGIEVELHGTDPTEADTDGDGHGDGAEIAAGTDPLDPLDAPETVAIPALGPWGAAALALLLGALGSREVRRRRR